MTYLYDIEGMGMKKYFILDLNQKKIEVELYAVEDMLYDLKHFKLKDPLKLSNYDYKVFDSEAKAEKWLIKFNKTLNELDNKKICKSRDLPAILLKRRYMAQTLMKEKLQTYRNYKKDWKNGQLFNFHDQTFFLTVKLISIKLVKDKGYCYKFSLLK